MKFLHDHLIEGEKIVFQTRMHWMFFIPWMALSVVTLLTLFFVPQTLLAIGIVRIFGAIFLIKAIINCVIFLFSEYGISTHRILGKTGLVKIHSLDVLLLKTESVKLHKNLFGRILNFGDLVVSGTGGTKHTLHCLPKPQKIRKLIQQLANRAHAKTDGIRVRFDDVANG